MTICVCGHPAEHHKKSKGQVDCIGTTRKGEPCACMAFCEDHSASEQTKLEAEEEA